MVTSTVEEELRRLRKGYGLRRPDLLTCLGPALLRVGSIAEQDDRQAARLKLSAALDRWCSDLRPELQLAVRAALALDPRTQQRFLRDRMQWIAEQLHCDERTARRRVDEGLHLLAIALEDAAGQAIQPRRPVTDPDGWYFESFRALLRMDKQRPEAIEERVVVSRQPHLSEITAAISLPRHPADRSESHSLEVELLYGGELVLVEQPTEKHFQLHLRLPKELGAGERHEYGLRMQIPDGQLMAPHYVLTPFRRCDSFFLRARFRRDRAPSKLCRLEAVPFVMIDDPQASTEILEPDQFGEVTVEFKNLITGLGYGIQWS